MKHTTSKNDQDPYGGVTLEGYAGMPAEAPAEGSRQGAAAGVPPAHRVDPQRRHADWVQSDSVECGRQSTMTNALDGELRRLRTVVHSIDKLREAVAGLERVRNESVRRLYREGTAAVEIARQADIVRSRVYQIITRPEPDEDGELFADEWEWEQRFDDAMLIAHEEWHRAGGEGDPEDYFPLEDLLRGA